VLEQFTTLTKKSISAYINELISDRLKLALKSNEEEQRQAQTEEQEQQDSKEEKIETTVDELESFMIVKSILRSTIDVGRISYKDTQNYFNIMLDDSVRKTVCRLYYTARKKHIAIYDDQSRDFVKHTIEKLDDIFNFSEQIVTAAMVIEAK
jgi:hypothetical protein